MPPKPSGKTFRFTVSIDTGWEREVVQVLQSIEAAEKAARKMAKDGLFYNDKGGRQYFVPGNRISCIVIEETHGQGIETVDAPCSS